MYKLHQTMPANPAGRDFIIGDLHGCLDLLNEEMARVGFDGSRDRLFSVGDLADRGPDSIGCLRLLREPWFHAVRGNHEDMLLSFCNPGNMPPFASAGSGALFYRNGGDWVDHLTEVDMLELKNDLLPRVAALPFVLTIGEGMLRHHLVHSELMTSGSNAGASGNGLFSRLLGRTPRKPAMQILTDQMLTEETLAQLIEPMIWGRRLVQKAETDNAVPIETPLGTLLKSPTPIRPGLSLTYVGHTPVRNMLLHESHVFIDRGAYTRKPGSRLLMLEHRQVLEWIGLPVHA
jgi:serine/threonine protein phosphatase 1